MSFLKKKKHSLADTLAKSFCLDANICKKRNDENCSMCLEVLRDYIIIDTKGKGLYGYQLGNNNRKGGINTIE